MNAHQEVDVIAIVQENPAAVFTDKNVSFGAVADALEKREADATVDLGSDKGRKAIASRAYSVAKLKTSIDGAGKALNDDKRKEIEKVDAVRRNVRDTLDALRDRIRKPLDNWEAQEEARVDSHKATIQRLTELGHVSMEASAADIEAQLSEVKAIDVSAGEMQEFAELAAGKKEASIGYLTSALERVRREEQDRIELERLRTEAAEREARDAAEREAREAKEREAEAARQQAIADERRKAEIAEAEARAAERARKEAEEKADRERQELIRQQEEADRRRALTEARQREEDAARARDKAHRGRVNSAAAAALAETCSVDEQTAKAIVSAIYAGSIPAVSIKY